MRQTLVLVAAALALVGTAEAKGPMSARTCGSSGCVTLTGTAVYRLEEGLRAPFLLLGVPRPARFYTVAFEGRGFSWSYVYVPSRRIVRIADGTSSPYWRAAPETLLSTLSRLTRGLKPYAASPTWRPSRNA